MRFVLRELDILDAFRVVLVDNTHHFTSLHPWRFSEGDSARATIATHLDIPLANSAVITASQYVLVRGAPQ